MSTAPLSPLRQRMIEDMSLRNLAHPGSLHPWLPEAGPVRRRAQGRSGSATVRRLSLRSTTAFGSRGQPLPQESARPRHHFQK
jgi:hypothetical protein